MSEDTGKKWDDSLISMGLGALVVVVSGILLFNYFNNQTPKLIRDQGQKPIAVSSTMPASQQNSGPTATSSAKILAQVATTAPKATATPKLAQEVKPTIAPNVNDSKTLPATYTVLPGDSLWAVSQKFYGTGYEWKQIATANKLGGTYTLEKGQVLNVPKVELISATSTEKAQIAKASTAPSNKPSQSTAPAVGGANVTPTQNATTAGAVTYTVAHGDTLWSIATTQCNNGYLWSSVAKQNKLVKPGVIHTGNTFTFTCS
jgi:nucleoid-associated protein YgaU